MTNHGHSQLTALLFPGVKRTLQPHSHILGLMPKSLHTILYNNGLIWPDREKTVPSLKKHDSYPPLIPRASLRSQEKPHSLQVFTPLKFRLPVFTSLSFCHIPTFVFTCSPLIRPHLSRFQRSLRLSLRLASSGMSILVCPPCVLNTQPTRLFTAT